VSLIANGLIIYKNSIFNDVPLATLYTFIVIANSAKRTYLRFIGYNVDNFTSEIKILGLPFVQGEETGARKVCFVTKYSI